MSACRRGIRHAGHRLARTARQHAAAVVGARPPTRWCSKPSIAATMSARWPRGCGPMRSRGPVSQRRNAGRPGTAAAAGVLLLLGLAAGHVRRHLDEFGDLDTAARQGAIQLNDTHPAIAVAELMRLLVDEHGCLGEAWRITTRQRFLHQSHAAARGARDLAGAADRASAAAAHADHLSDQLAASAKRARRGFATPTRLPRSR